jgi:hypothetical protein
MTNNNNTPNDSTGSNTVLSPINLTQEALETILDTQGNRAYSMIRSWLFKKANGFAPDEKAFKLHIVCNKLIPIIQELEPEYFQD